MKDAPAFDFFPERFWFAVEGWTEAEICRYFRLLSQQWLRDGLPADPKELAGLARGRLSDRLAAKFPVGPDGRRRNPFLESIRAKQRERITKRREGAAITNARRWGTTVAPDSLSDSLADGSATGERPASDIATDSPPPTTHHSPRMGEESPMPPLVGSTPTRPVASPSINGRWFKGYSPEFERLWRAYPRKTGKGAAWAAWQRVRQRPDIDTLVAALTTQSGSVKWTEEDGRFIPHPATWLNQRRWDDELFAAPPTAPPPDPTKRSWE